MNRTSQPSRGFALALVFTAAASGYLLGFVFVHWQRINPNFFQLTIGDVFQLLATIILATVVATWIRRKTSREEHRSQLMLELIGEFHKDIDTIFDLGEEYIATRSANNADALLRSLQTASSKLSLIFEVHNIADLKPDSGICDNLKNKFFSYKRVITNDPFGQPQTPYTIAQKEEFQFLHSEILTLTYKLRLQSYI